MEIVRVEDSDLHEIEGNRYRTFRAVSEPLTANVILNDIERCQRLRVLVICNTVSLAQGIFRDLEELAQNVKLKITLLHSRFLPKDRAKKESYLKEKFAQSWREHDDEICQVLISTQVIEAGMNITCEVMHTHLCPMNSLLQRAGRCARFRGQRGEVYIYRSFQINTELTERDLDTESDFPAEKSQSFLPYPKESCELTWQVLQEHTQSEQADQNVGFRLEEQWIDRVHSQEDLLQHQRRLNNKMNFEQQFNATYLRGEQSAANELIRSVDSRSVFVWEEPIFLDDEQIDPQQLLAFSVPVTYLCKVWREFQALEYKADWIFKRIEAPKGKAGETYSQPVCTQIASRQDLITSVRILVNPRYVHYDDKIGLLIGVDTFGNRFSSPEKKQTIASEYKYRMDTYVGHLVLMWKCWREPFSTTQLRNGEPIEMQYASVRDELLQAGGRFIRTRIFPQAEEADVESLFEYLVFFAILTHDLGKLQVKWQEVMRGWQAIAHQQFGGRNPRSHLLAHTDYNPEDKHQKAALKAYEKQHQRPNHAIESAFLSRDILKQSLLPLLRDHFDADLEQISCILHTVVMAVGRHHSAWAAGWGMGDLAKIGNIQLSLEAKQTVRESWCNLTHFLPKPLPLPEANLTQDFYPVRELELNRFEADQIEYLQLYLLVVRALRLCDQRSVQLQNSKTLQ